GFPPNIVDGQVQRRGWVGDTRDLEKLIHGEEIDVGKPVQRNFYRMPLAITSKPELRGGIDSQRQPELATAAALDSDLHGRGVPRGGSNVKVKISVRIVVHVSEIGQEDAHAEP